MIETWLAWPAYAIFAALIALYGATAALIVWVSYSETVGHTTRRYEGVVAPFFGSVGVLFALLTGFLASDIGDRSRQATRAVQVEAGELRNVFTLSVASVSDMSAIRAAWSAYVDAVLKDEWPAMARGVASTAAGAAYDELLREVSTPQIATESGAAVHAALMTATVRVGTARSDRLALASDHTNDLKWIMVLLLGVMTQVAVGLVHLHKSKAQTAALAVFSVSAVIALGMIGLQERPFAGEVHVTPAPLLELVKLKPPA